MPKQTAWHRALRSVIRAFGIDENEVRSYCKVMYKKECVKDLDAAEAAELTQQFIRHPPRLNDE
jgi:hypothetical protein